MKRFSLAAFVAALFLVVALAVTPGAAQTPPPAEATTTTTTAPAPPPSPYPAGCVTFSSRHWFKKYSRRVYHGKFVSKAERRQMRHLRHCARSAEYRGQMHRFQMRQSHQRKVRARRLCGSPACNRRLGFYMADRRFGPGAGACLDSFIRHESGWSMDIGYGGSHGPPGNVAWGIPQALPPSKMASAGADWASNPRTQIRWLLSYVMRYGGPCGAAAHWRASRSY